MKKSPGALLLVNGKIHTMGPLRPLVAALAIRDGKILSAGSDAETRDVLLPAERDNVIDLKGACAIVSSMYN